MASHHGDAREGRGNDRSHTQTSFVIRQNPPDRKSLCGDSGVGDGGGGAVPQGALGRPRPVSHADSTLMKC